ncbi:uncharacterized protein LOC142461329 [Tenrec ecaudatus]|uniref:uncharacterized protein LOC142461329 n=1 Tax=Tenrec ecaudatus TaxID=94439 RepID=UPI003F5A62AF
MLRVAHLVSVCCPRRQTGPDLEAAVEGLRRLVARVQALFSPSHRSTGLRGSPAAQEALLQAWARASDALLARFDDVLDIPEFLSVSTQEMTEHVDLSAWALKRGERTAFSQQVAYVQGRAAHVAQVMRRSVDQERDPIFRNGLRVLIQQLEQSARVLRAVAERCAGTGHSLADEDAFFTAAKRLLDSAQRVREGLDGTNHPDILSPLRAQVHKFDTAKSQPWFILSDLQDAKAFELPGQQESGLGERDLETAYPPPGRPSCSLSPGLLPQRVGSLLPTNEASLSVQPHGHQAGTSASTKLQGQDAAVGVTLGALAGESEMTGLQGPSTLAPSTGEPAREMAGSDGLLAGTPLLCGKTRGSRQGLVGAVGDWLPLCQQLFCHLPPADLPESRAAFMELQKDLGIMVQLAAKGSPEALSPGVTDSMGHSAVLLQMQGRLADVEARAKELLDKIGASDGLQAPKLQEENIEDACLLWSAAVQELLQCVERLSWRQGLFLLPLRRAMKNPQGLQTGLVQAADVSQRLQEAARLSSLLCGDGQVKGAVSFLCREVRVLTEALLDVAQILVSSPKPSPSLSTRFELLCWELTLQAKALTGCLSSINVEYEHALQHAICSSLAACKAPQTVLEGTLGRMVSGIQAVQETVAGSQDAGPCPEGLLVALENILNLTKEVAQRVSELREDPEQRDLYILDCLQWQWAAKAHYAVAQLRAWKGGVTEAWRLLAQCFKPSDEPGQPQEPGPVQPQLCGEEAAAGSVDAQEAARTDPPGSSMEMCTAEPAGSVTAATTEEPGTLSHAPSSSTDLVTGPPTEPTQPPRKEASTENRITQLTREMAKEVFLMAQSSKRRGHALTKDQLITSARKIATSGQNFAKFIHIVAKNCIDPRYSQELLCVVEQIQTMSNQLRIISSVKASLARSKSSEELLLGNAQQLLRVVTEAGRAAEAASLRGLRTPSPDPEEVEVAAVCMQWRRRLRRHRRVAASNLDRGDGGLRKTGANTAPTLSALLEEAV